MREWSIPVAQGRASGHLGWRVCLESLPLDMGGRLEWEAVDGLVRYFSTMFLPCQHLTILNGDPSSVIEALTLFPAHVIPVTRECRSLHHRHHFSFICCSFAFSLLHPAKRAPRLRQNRKDWSESHPAVAYLHRPTALIPQAHPVPSTFPYHCSSLQYCRQSLVEPAPLAQWSKGSAGSKGHWSSVRVSQASFHRKREECTLNVAGNHPPVQLALDSRMGREM